MLIIQQITNPSADWVEARLKKVEFINDVGIVTKKNDPDGLLGKEGAYQNCLYFGLSVINQNEIKGQDIVQKGTDAGGAIEIYKNKNEAEERCNYLKGFDGTVLYSGSYAIVGTMVIRISYILTNEQQLEMTDRITHELTLLE